MKKTLALLIGVVFAVVLFVPISDATEEHTGTKEVTNESLTADPGTYQDLKGFDIDNSETVYWLNSTSGNYETLSKGSEYEMNYSAGEILLLESSSVSDGDDVRVSYQYQQTSQTTTTVVTLIPLLLAVLIIASLGNEISNKT